MSTQFHYTGETRWIHPPEDDSRNPSPMMDNVWSAGESSHDWPQRGEKTTAVMSEFVEKLKDNPKVWAVCATEDSDGINVWTYIDSRSEPDLMAVFDAEWQLRKAYPRTAFGFNTVSVQVGEEEFDGDELDFLYRR